MTPMLIAPGVEGAPAAVWTGGIAGGSAAGEPEGGEEHGNEGGAPHIPFIARPAAET